MPITFVWRKNYRSLRLSVKPLKFSLLTWPSGPLDVVLAPPLVTSLHSLLHTVLQWHKLLGVGCLCAISYLRTFAHPGSTAWPIPVPPPQRSFPWAPSPTPGQSLSSGLGSRASLGIPVALCPLCGTYLCASVSSPHLQDAAFPRC